MRKIYFLIFIALALQACKKSLTSYSNTSGSKDLNSLIYSYYGSSFYLVGNCIDSISLDTAGLISANTTVRCYVLSATDGINHLEISIPADSLNVGTYNLSTPGSISVYKYNKGEILGSSGSFQLVITDSDNETIGGYFKGQLYNILYGGIYPIEGYFSNVRIRNIYFLN